MLATVAHIIICEIMFQPDNLVEYKSYAGFLLWLGRVEVLNQKTYSTLMGDYFKNKFRIC